MMSTAFVASYLALWVLVVCIATAVFVLYHIEGQRYLTSREGRRAQGPPIGLPLNIEHEIMVDGEKVPLLEPGRANVLIFAAPNCQLCSELQPAINSFAKRHVSVTVSVVCTGRIEAVRRWAAGLERDVRMVPDSNGRLAQDFGVALTPFVVIGDSVGIIRHKGVVSDELALEFAAQDVVQAIPSEVSDGQEGFILAQPAAKSTASAT